MVLTLYAKAGCHLCEDAAEAVRRIATERGVELDEVDISLDPVLHRRYGERIPVVALNGEEVMELVVDATKLREELDRRLGASPIE
jgi:glutaredoxin